MILPTGVPAAGHLRRVRWAVRATLTLGVAASVAAVVAVFVGEAQGLRERRRKVGVPDTAETTKYGMPPPSSP